MPRRGPEGVSPAEIFLFPMGETPPDDRAYFEILTWFVFGAGLNWRILRSKWPNLQAAFNGFDIDTVARYAERDIDRLLADASIIRNGRKVVSTIENARKIQAIHAAGGMTHWLRAYGADNDALIRAVKKHFDHIGDVTSRMFLTAVGAIEYQSWQPTDRQRGGTV